MRLCAGKDRLVKYWDMDKFELLLTLEGHCAEVWCLAVGSLGDLLVSGSHDRSLRRWERTEEPFFVEEEKEKRLESLFEGDLEVRECRGGEGRGTAKVCVRVGLGEQMVESRRCGGWGVPGVVRCGYLDMGAGVAVK